MARASPIRPIAGLALRLNLARLLRSLVISPRLGVLHLNLFSSSSTVFSRTFLVLSRCSTPGSRSVNLLGQSRLRARPTCAFGIATKVKGQFSCFPCESVRYLCHIAFLHPGAFHRCLVRAVWFLRFLVFRCSCLSLCPNCVSVSGIPVAFVFSWSGNLWVLLRLTVFSSSRSRVRSRYCCLPSQQQCTAYPYHQDLGKSKELTVPTYSERVQTVFSATINQVRSEVD